ncbi:MAG: uroporphyrinogen-III synthase [Caulobacteraceae bacterium]|nr:uroporphyrinogen-III synthase [Caulobacteraceae bacterium]
MTARRIWVTRTRPGAEATAARLAALGHEPVVQPLLEVRAIADAVIDLAGVDALAFTSGQAIRAFASLSSERRLAVFTVGEGTAALARAAGFADVSSADGDVRALAALIVGRQPRPSRVLAPGAREVAADLPALLAERGLAATALAVYETLEAASPAPPERIGAVLIHSPKAARALAARLAGWPQASKIDAFAISEAAAAPLRRAGLRSVTAAPRPSEDSLLALLKG